MGYELLLFPACAGVILYAELRSENEAAFPRVCGGDPIKDSYDKDGITFSPRVRG